MNIKKNAAFTLIELLVVVLIIGILAAIAVPQYQRAVLTTRVTTLLPLLRSISDAQNLFYMTHGRYTLTFANLSIAMPDGGRIYISEAGREHIVFHDYACYLGNWSGGYSAYCNSSAKDAPQLEKYFASDHFICWASPNSEMQISVCQNISGKEEPGGLGPNGLYRFQFN